MNAVLENFASHNFSAYAAKNIRVDEDRNGLLCKVPDQSGKWYTVRCEEGRTSVHASHCNCSRQHCEHVDTVQAYWNKLYKIEAPRVESVAAIAERDREAQRSAQPIEVRWNIPYWMMQRPGR